jgi:hypothetical protein
MTNERFAYSIVCSLDLSEAPSLSKADNLEWTMRFFSSDALLIAKNISKENIEKSVKESWEITQPGRSVMAKNSRYNYIINNKLEKQEQLNNEELKYLDLFKKANGNKDNMIKIQGVDIHNNNNNDNLFYDNKLLDRSKGKNNNYNNKINSDSKKNLLKIDLFDENNYKINNEIRHNTNEVILSPKDNSDNLNFYRTFMDKKFIPETSINFFRSPKNIKSNLIKNFIEYVDEDRTKIKKDNFISNNSDINTNTISNFNFNSTSNKIKALYLKIKY